MAESVQRLLVFAPTRRASSETFVRANLAGLPFAVSAYFGDEYPLHRPARLTYGLSVLVSKACTRLGWLRLAEWPAALVALALVQRHRPDVVLADEPTGNLDPQNAREALQLIREVCEESAAALLIVSHDPMVLDQFDDCQDLTELNHAAQEVSV